MHSHFCLTLPEVCSVVNAFLTILSVHTPASNPMSHRLWVISNVLFRMVMLWLCIESAIQPPLKPMQGLDLYLRCCIRHTICSKQNAEHWRYSCKRWNCRRTWLRNRGWISLKIRQNTAIYGFAYSSAEKWLLAFGSSDFYKESSHAPQCSTPNHCARAIT